MLILNKHTWSFSNHQFLWVASFHLYVLFWRKGQGRIWIRIRANMHTALKESGNIYLLAKTILGFQKDRGTCDLNKCWRHGRNSSTSWKYCSHLLQKPSQVICCDIAYSKNYSWEGWQSTHKSCHTHIHCKHINLYVSFGHQLQLTRKVPSCIPVKTNVNLLGFIFCFLVPL